jgi:hypothetical protein
MARIRTIKPEFWTSEQVAECSPNARLLFIGIWSFCDDNGIHPASVKRLKMEVFPSDVITDAEIQTMINELLRVGLLHHYTVKNQWFWHVTGWAKHQKIDKPTYRHPLPNQADFADGSASTPGTFGEASPSAPLRNGMESNGMESNGVDITNPVGLVVASQASDLLGDAPATQEKKTAADSCPHQKIIDLYHEVLPMCPRVRDWTAKRAKQLRARWNEDKSRQSLEYWKGLFEYIAECDFLVGKAGRSPFFANLDWITKSINFTNIREGKYENRRAA